MLRLLLPCLLLLVCCTALSANEQLYADNVVVALDVSGSMNRDMSRGGDTRMETAKEALLTVTSQLGPNTNIGLYTFGKHSGWQYELSPLNSEKLQAAIRQSRPGGNTPLGATLQIAANALLAQRAKQHGYGSYRLLVVTDGEASDARLMEAMIPQVLSRGITLDAIGLDMASAHSLATKAHSYKSAYDREALTKAIAAAFAEIPADDQASLEMFDLLAGLDSEVAAAALNAYATSGNEPIGGKRQAKPGAAPASATTPKQAPPSQSKESAGDFGAVLQGIFFAIIFLVIVTKLVSKKSRRH
jgi:uncharacterized protein YegL